MKNLMRPGFVGESLVGMYIPSLSRYCVTQCVDKHRSSFNAFEFYVTHDQRNFVVGRDNLRCFQEHLCYTVKFSNPLE